MGNSPETGLFAEIQDKLSKVTILDSGLAIIEGLTPILPQLHPDDVEIIEKMHLALQEVRRGSQRFYVKSEVGVGINKGQLLGMRYNEIAPHGEQLIIRIPGQCDETGEPNNSYGLTYHTAYTGNEGSQSKIKPTRLVVNYSPNKQEGSVTFLRILVAGVTFLGAISLEREYNFRHH